ncbi:cyclic peptide export ABC transporter [Wukongibacter sp. M2B1]|uniref:cyclic peptide export ABC transporter n=1 Tax=Wukongibacter sp. M2B1 TaxID=3088895 RepID=UPI003D7B8D23
MKKYLIILFAVFIIISSCSAAFASTNKIDEDKMSVISDYISKNFEKLKVPGLSIGIIQNGNIEYLNFGVSDINKDIEVSKHTNYEIGSLTKGFTALAIVKLEKDGVISLEDKVSDYFPGFKCQYRGNEYEITIEQLIHHTSGIGTNSIRLLREDDSEMALRKLVEVANGTALDSKPGTRYEYATINYDILGAIIEEVSGETYESYMEKNIFKPLKMEASYVGINPKDNMLSKGYKINYFKPREYQAPVFRNNYPAGYVVSNTEDMMKWLKFQLGSADTKLDSIMEITHEPNKKVPSVDNSYYGKGWFIVSNRFDEINHGGNNPNFGAYISFNKKDKSGIIALANSNSENFHEMANNISTYLYGGQLENLENKASTTDTVFSVFSIVFLILCILILGSWIYVFYEYKKGKRSLGFKKGSFKKLIINLIFLSPVFICIYLLPKALSGTDWYTAIIWTSSSFVMCIGTLLCFLILSYLTHIILLLFPHNNKYFKDAPEIITLGIVAGLCNAIVIFLITNALNGRDNLKYFVFFFITALVIYILGRRSLEIRLAEIAQSVIKSLRETIFDRLFETKYEEFEKMESGKIIATITQDINQIGDLARVVIIVATSAITIIAVFIYLAAISAFATLAAIIIIIIVGAIYAYFDGKAGDFFEGARDTQNKFMAKVEALMGGFKDLSLHRTKKRQYRTEASEINTQFMNNNVKAFRMFVNAFMLGESLFIIVLGFIVFAFPFIFKFMTRQELTIFVMMLLYILGPIAGILNAVPEIAQIKVAINRVKQLLDELPKRSEGNVLEAVEIEENIENICINNISFEYENAEGNGFKLGPIDLDINKGEILFIVGGNGSGKSTLIKLITGLYKSNSGSIKINYKEIDYSLLGEHISSVFTDSYLFERFYNTDLEKKDSLIQDYLKEFELDKKVEINGDTMSTTLLSTGQRKRMQLLRCYLENKPIFIFDELAADQDPHFRKYFYRTLLPKMREEGKIVIAVTHDDHYFDVADRVVKLDMGKIDKCNNKYMAVDM